MVRSVNISALTLLELDTLDVARCMRREQDMLEHTNHPAGKQLQILNAITVDMLIMKLKRYQTIHRSERTISLGKYHNLPATIPPQPQRPP